MGRYCRDCLHAQVIGLSLGEPVCRCALGCWGPESWPCALVVPACGNFEPAAEQPDDLDFWGAGGWFRAGAGAQAQEEDTCRGYAASVHTRSGLRLTPPRGGVL
jgi:hypothetical protein